MARIEEIERRLQNWARWKQGAGSGGLGYGSSWSSDGGGSRYREAVIPTFDHEAAITDEGVNALEARLRLTLHQVYLTADSPELDARQLGISKMAVDARVWQAHRHLSSWLAERAEIARRERERVESLQRH